MEGARHIILVDGDVRRRATISHDLAGRGIHVEPFETVAELGGRWPREGLALIHDADDAVSSLAERLAHAGTWLAVVAFAPAPKPRRVVDAILGGAVDYLAWPFDDAELAFTLATAPARARTAGHARLRQAMARNRVGSLTPRERAVLGAMAAGLPNRAIAEQLSISPRTVEIHRANLLTKMGAAHTSEAIRIAIEAALVDDSPG